MKVLVGLPSGALRHGSALYILLWWWSKSQKEETEKTEMSSTIDLGPRSTPLTRTCGGIDEVSPLQSWTFCSGYAILTWSPHPCRLLAMMSPPHHKDNNVSHSPSPSLVVGPRSYEHIFQKIFGQQRYLAAISSHWPLTQSKQKTVSDKENKHWSYEINIIGKAPSRFTVQ